MLACQVLDKHNGGEIMEQTKLQNKVVMLAGMVGVGILTNSFEPISKQVQELLIDKEPIIAIMCLDELVKSGEKEMQIAQFLDKHKQEFNALTKVVLNELEKELRLEEKEDE